jgi:hypothetical protein
LVLAPDVGSSSPARWTGDTRGLPAGHYDLVLDTEATDLAGQSATASPPTLSFDVAPLAAPAADDFDPAVLAVLAPTAPTILGDETGETGVLVGSTSLLTVGRTIIVFDSLAGRRTLNLFLRFQAPSSVSQVPAMITVFDARGLLVGQGTDYQYFGSASTVTGFDLETVPHVFPVGYVASTAGRYYAVIEPGGPADVSCSGQIPVTGIATTLDQVAPM